jgi:hypothetical protein
MGLQFDVAKDGEPYMIAQGAGGGYGDPLERDPESVTADAELGRISAKVARDIFAVVYDEATAPSDAEATATARADTRARLQRPATKFSGVRRRVGHPRAAGGPAVLRVPR